MVVVVVGEKRTAQCPPGDRLEVQNGPDSCEARPRSRVQNCRPPQVVVHPVCPS